MWIPKGDFSYLKIRRNNPFPLGFYLILEVLNQQRKLINQLTEANRKLNQNFSIAKQSTDPLGMWADPMGLGHIDPIVMGPAQWSWAWLILRHVTSINFANQTRLMLFTISVFTANNSGKRGSILQICSNKNHQVMPKRNKKLEETGANETQVSFCPKNEGIRNEDIRN